MASVEDLLNDVVDTPEEGIEQHEKREELKNVIDKGKLGHKWTNKRVDKANDEIINKTYAEYKQRELNEKGKKLERPWVSMSLIYTLLEFLDGLKSKMLRNYEKTLRMTQSLKIKWRIESVFLCVRLVIILRLF